MNASVNLEKICERVVEIYRKIYGNAIHAVFLYGSYARGDYDEESDIDFAAIVEGNQIELRQKRSKVSRDLSKICLDYDVVISFGIIPANYFDRYYTEVPYYRNVVEEGKRLA